MNVTTRIHDSLTFLGATWAGHKWHLTLELDQCSNSRTHQDLAPTKTHMEVHILSNGIKTQEMKNKNWKLDRIEIINYCTEQKLEAKLENRNSNGRNEKKQQTKLIYRMELKEHEGRTLIEGVC